jgi:hypothetical protein
MAVAANSRHCDQNTGQEKKDHGIHPTKKKQGISGAHKLYPRDDHAMRHVKEKLHVTGLKRDT